MTTRDQRMTVRGFSFVRVVERGTSFGRVAGVAKTIAQALVIRRRVKARPDAVSDAVWCWSFVSKRGTT